MSSVACRICLRTNIPMLDLPDQLKTFYDELCDFESVQHKRLKYCALCAHQMKKCYKFKGQCLSANGLLKLWIKHENKDISEYHKELPSPSLQITNNSTSSLFECQHDEKTLHKTNVTSDCNRNLVLKLNRSALAPDDRMHPESSKPSLNSNHGIPDLTYPDLRPAVRLSSGLRPGLRPNIGSRPALRLNGGLRPGIRSDLRPRLTEHVKAENGMLTFDPNFLSVQSRLAIRPNLVLRPALRPNVNVPALKPNSDLELAIQLLPSGSKQPKQTFLNFDHDYDVSNETDPLSSVKDENAMGFDKNTMESVEKTMKIGDEESVVEIEHQRRKKEVYIDDNTTESDDTIASLLEIEQKEVDNNEYTIGSTKPEEEELYDNDSMDDTKDNKGELINIDDDIDSDEYTYEYLEQDIDLLDLAIKPKQEESSESTSIDKKQDKKTTVKEPPITILKIEDVSNKNAFQLAQNENNIPLEAKVKRITRKYNKKTKVNLNTEYPYISHGPKAVPNFKASCLVGLFDESPLVLDDETVLTKELFSVIYDKFNVRELKRLAVILLEDEYREKLTAYLGVLYRKYNPEYESIFHVEYLHTEEQKIEDFKRRELHPDYIRAAYKCELCYKTYTGQSFLDSHKKTHHNPASPLVCSICSYSMPTKRSLGKHRIAVHQATYSCKLCPLKTNRVIVIKKHYNTHKGVEYQCPVCLKVCYNANTLNSHKRRAHATHVCTTCGLQYTTEKGLRIHRETQHKDAPPVEPAQTVPCAACDITFDTRQSYLRHCTFAHTPIRKRSIPRRNRYRPPPTEPTSPKVKKAENEQDVKRKQNKKKRKKKRVYRTCEVCHEKVYVEKFGARLYNHFLEKHPGVPYHAKDMKAKDFLCDECGKAFLCPATLRDHKNSHTGLRPYMCELCPARFHTNGNLWRHRVQKHCDRSHRCEQCGKLFKNATHLWAHMRIHIGDRRFKCHICDKGFLYNGSLKEHVNGVHYKERRVKRKKPAQSSLMPVSE